MELAHEGNTDLAFDTSVMRNYGEKYGEIAVELRNMSKELNSCLTTLKNSGWTTPAGEAFQKMAETDWEDNINKYADLLETLQKIIFQSADKYDRLVENNIENTRIKL